MSNDVSGGFIGYIDEIDNLYIINSFNSGSIFTDDDLGGLVGRLTLRGEFVVQNSFNSGDLFTEDDNIGGIVSNINYDDNEDDARVFFNNVYNSGTITISSEGNDVGGLIAYLDDYIDLKITNSFNVGTFSSNLIGDDLQFEGYGIGGIIGEFNGFLPLFNNVFVYVDTANALDYVSRVSGNGWSAGARLVTDIEDFTDADFRLSNKWNFETVWEFNEDSLFPVLQDLDFVKVGLDYDYKPSMGYSYSNFETDYALGFTYLDLEFSAYDFETPSEDLIVKMYLTNEYYEGPLEGFLDIATLIGTYAGDEVIETFTYVTEAAATYYAWLYVEDSIGQFDLVYMNSFNTFLD